MPSSGKLHKPANAKESFKFSKGQLQCGVGVLVCALIIGISHVLSPSEEDAAAAVVPKSGKASNVVTALDDATFDNFAASHPEGFLVDFYSKNCKFCTKLAPEYEKAAQEVKKDGPPLASVDAEAGSQLMQRFGITRYPTVLWFWKGEQVLELPRASEKPAAKIAEWARWATTPAVQELDTREEFDAALLTLRSSLHAKARLMVAFNRADSDGLRAAFEAAAQRHRATTVFLYIKEVLSGEPLLRSYGQEQSHDEDYQGAPTREEVIPWVKGVLDKAKPPKDDAANVATEAKSAADKAIDAVQKALENAEAKQEDGAEQA